MNMNIPGIDTEKAIKNLGSESLFLELLGDVYKLMDEKCAQVTSYVSNNDLHNYTILVHSLKTTCRMIGAMDLGEQFFTLEKLGKENDAKQIRALTPDVIRAYQSLKPYLAPFALGDNQEKNSFDQEAVSMALRELVTALDNFDLGKSEAAIQELMTYHYSPDLFAQIETLDKLVTNLDYEDAIALAKELLTRL